MGSGSLALILCKPSPLAFLAPLLIPSSTHLNRLQLLPRSSFRRMASSSPPRVAGGDAIDPQSNHNGSPTDPLPSCSSSPSLSAASVVDFLTLCHRLKTTKRAGWVKRDVKDPESIADHMYRMGIMALVASDMPGIDRDRCLKIAIVHDIAEAIVGDITPSDGVPKLEKSRREREAVDHMCKLLGGGPRAEEIESLWMEYEENFTPEAKVVKDFDKVEMILQALEYETEQGKDLEEFFQSTAGKFQTDIGKAWASEIASRRKKR